MAQRQGRLDRIEFDLGRLAPGVEPVPAEPGDWIERRPRMQKVELNERVRVEPLDIFLRFSLTDSGQNRCGLGVRVPGISRRPITDWRFRAGSQIVPKFGIAPQYTSPVFNPSSDFLFNLSVLDSVMPEAPTVAAKLYENL